MSRHNKFYTPSAWRYKMKTKINKPIYKKYIHMYLHIIIHQILDSHRSEYITIYMMGIYL